VLAKLIIEKEVISSSYLHEKIRNCGSEEMIERAANG
jgi:hypothetical protein